MNGFAEPSALPSSISLSALNRSKSRSRRLRLRLVEQSLNCVSDIGSAVDVDEVPRWLARLIAVLRPAKTSGAAEVIMSALASTGRATRRPKA